MAGETQCDGFIAAVTLLVIIQLDSRGGQAISYTNRSAFAFMETHSNALVRQTTLQHHI